MANAVIAIDGRSQDRACGSGGLVATAFEADGEATVRCHDSITQPSEWHAVTITAIEAQSIEQVPLV